MKDNSETRSLNKDSVFKVQNNFQVQVNTSSYEMEQRQMLETASAKALEIIKKKLRKEQTPALKYLHAIQ